MSWLTRRSTPQHDGPATPTELTILGEQNLLLARCDLAGTTWRLLAGGHFENCNELRTKVVADGIARVCYIGVRPNEVHLDIVGRRLQADDTIVFRPGKIVISNSWKDTPRAIAEDRRRLEPPSGT